MRKAMTFKALVKEIASCKLGDENRCNEICGLINFSFEHEKITWDDHETLYTIMNAYFAHCEGYSHLKA